MGTAWMRHGHGMLCVNRPSGAQHSPVGVTETTRYTVLPSRDVLCSKATEGFLRPTDKQCTYNVNTETRSHNHCYRGRAVSMAYSEYVSRSHRYPACNAHAPYCHLCPAPLYHIFPHYLVNGTIFEKKKVIEHKTCFDFLCNFYLKQVSF
jgi:hypothetical protein